MRREDNVISLAWPVSPLRDAIAVDEVHLWSWTLERSAVDLSADSELLDDQERQRLGRFHFVQDRDRYAAAHGNLRRILGAYLGQPPGTIRFRVNRFGKPELADSSSCLSFNLTHTQKIAIVAVAYEAPVGVDAEEIHPIEPEVADMHFSPAELSQLKTLKGDARLTGFFRCWTRKEAVLKGEGVGLHLPLDSFDVSLGETAELLEARQRFSYRWNLHHLEPAAGVVGALATPLSHPKVCFFSM